MCLTISFAHHINNKPKIAYTDILVYKCLDTHTLNGTPQITTPYRDYPITFDENGIFTYPKVRLEKLSHEDIGQGIHAYYYDMGARQLAAKYKRDFGCKMFYAIIPKGSRYFIGLDFQIVANNMTIFKTKEEYDEYAKTHKTISLKW